MWKVIKNGKEKSENFTSKGIQDAKSPLAYELAVGYRCKVV